jgi:hypothetical protein
MGEIVSDLIEFILVFVAILAALYARWAWSEARRANEIAVHSNRMDIYRALHNLRFLVQSKGIMIEAQHVAPFFHPSREARFYFSNTDTSQNLVEYFDVCFGLAECTRKLSRSNLSETDIKKLRDEQDALAEREETLFREAEKRVEEELYGAVRRGSRIA